MLNFWSTLTLLLQTLHETIPQKTRRRLQNSKQSILTANSGKFLVDTGATLTLLSQTLYETIPQKTRPILQNLKQSILAANGGALLILT